MVLIFLKVLYFFEGFCQFNVSKLQDSIYCISSTATDLTAIIEQNMVKFQKVSKWYLDTLRATNIL